jgi:hypothetical protein
VNFVDHTRTDQSSILQLVEDNRSTGRIGDASFDTRAGGLGNKFDFSKPQTRTVAGPEVGCGRQQRRQRTWRWRRRTLIRGSASSDDALR